MKKNFNLRKQRGLTLVELAMGVVIGGLILAASLGIVRTVMADNRVNDEINELSLVVGKVGKMYANRATFVGATTAMFISNGIYPPERITSATALNNRWGGTITVGVATTTTTNDSITLTYTNVAERECKGMIPQLENSMRIISVGGTVVKADGAQTDLAALGTQCVAGGNANTIVYTFSK